MKKFQKGGGVIVDATLQKLRQKVNKEREQGKTNGKSK